MKQSHQEDSPWSKYARVIFSWIGIILTVFLIMWAFRTNEETEYEINFPTFQQLLNDQKFADGIVKITSYNVFDFHGKLKEPWKFKHPAVKLIVTLRASY